MSTSDQHQHVADRSSGSSQHVADRSSGSSQHVADRSSGSSQLTRKQLREARLTGSTPIVSPEEAEAARQQAVAEPAPQAPPTPAPQVAEPPAPQAVEPPAPPAPEPSAFEPEDAHDAEGRLTRRQMREQERVRTGSVALPEEAAQTAEAPAAAPIPPSPVAQSPFAAAPSPVVAPAVPTAPAVAPAAPATTSGSDSAGMITDVPRPAYPSRRRSFESAAGPRPSSLDEQDGVDDAEQSVAPVSASAVMRAEEETGRSWHAGPAAGAPASEQPSRWPAPAAPAQPGPVEEAPRPTAPAAASGSAISPGFGERVLSEQPKAPRADSFDALIGDSTGSHHAAPNALIFQQAPTGPSLAGPVASTGEILVTGSYDLPAGLGSRGHADGVADGKEVDVVLVDGELAPASSPTPIAASAAIGTIKPAGEVIRPPEPEKGNKLMLALTITAGALAVALVGALIVAITTGAFS